MADEAPWWPWALGAAVGGVVVGTVATLLWRASQAPAAASTTTPPAPAPGSSTTTPPSTSTPSAPSPPAPQTVTVVDATPIRLSLRPGTALTLKLPTTGGLWQGTVTWSPRAGFTLTSAPLTATVSTPQTGTYNGGGVTLSLFWSDAQGGGWSTQVIVTDAG